MEIITADKDVTYEKIAKAIHRETSTVKKTIKKLKEKEVIRRVGSDRTGYWELLK